MQRLEFAKWVILSDPERTREVYAAIECGGSEECGCEICFNFATARHLVYSTDLVDLLEHLGIDPLLEARVSYLRRTEEGRHLYEIWFDFVGSIESGPVTTVANHAGHAEVSLEAVAPGLALGFSLERAPLQEVFAGMPVVRLEFAAEAPWVSNAPEPG